MEVIYAPAMVAPAQGSSPSAAKPAAVMKAWLQACPDLTVLPPVPVTLDDLLRAHQRRYVEDVLAQRIVNGFGTRSSAVNASLWQTCGAMLTAARRALQTGRAVAAPCSGFHHAGWDFGGGYCTFNGLMVTALALLHDDPDLRIGILDYDYHEGDGTAHILERLRPRGITHITAGAEWTEPEQARAFLEHIAHDLARLSGCDLVLYQAGADPHIDDPLGGFLTSAQMALRDWRVFDGLAQRGIPVAWNLAGGYQTPLARVIDLHLATLQLCMNAQAEAPPATRRRDRHNTAIDLDPANGTPDTPITAVEVRGGGRAEDRAEVFLRPGHAVLVIADGAGGTGSGARAAEAVVAEAQALFNGERASAAMALAHADHGLQGFGGQATGVIVEWRDGQLDGASVGDSVAWLVTGDTCIDLTGAQMRKPLLGDGALPVAFGPVPAHGRLLLATDGLVDHAPLDAVLDTVRHHRPGEAAERLVELPRLPNGEWPDDVAVVLAAWDG